MDCKLYASILARRLENIILELVDLDKQDLFLMDRHKYIMVHVSEKNIKTIVPRLDAEKAFDLIC